MSSELILGIDDAGRGPVIGPMIVAGCLITDEQAKQLQKLRVKDSKELTSRRREFLAEKIKEIAEIYAISIVYPEEIDKSLNSGKNLNFLEAEQFAEVINKINKGFNKIKVIADCPSVNLEKWKNVLKTKIINLSNLEITCEHKADKNYISVSAASILAKSRREEEMEILKEKYGEIGSGYCHDPLTCTFLEKYAKKHKDEGIFRKTWSTWKDICAKKDQKSLL